MARGIDKPGTPWLAGSIVMGVSACVVLAGVVLLGNTVGHVSARGAPWLKFIAIFGGVLMGLGYGVGSYSTSHHNPPWATAVGIVTKWSGTALMGFTLPTFVSHAVAVLGDVPFERHKGVVAIALMTGGVATLVISPSLASVPHMPLAASSAATVAATFTCALATGIYSCTVPTWPYARASFEQRWDFAPLPQRAQRLFTAPSFTIHLPSATSSRHDVASFEALELGARTPASTGSILERASSG